MGKRVVLVAPNGGAEIEIHESGTEAMVAKGWTFKSAKRVKPVKEGK